MCFSKQDITKHDELFRPIDNTLLDESLWNDKCDYISPDSCTNLNPDCYNLVVVQLNIRSLLSNQIELKQLLQTLG